jgi:hypothetical protein
VETLPFFVGDFDAVPGQDFPFGYTTAVNWFAADGIPIAAFDDFGRENPYPLMRVQAKALAGNDLGEPAEQVLASLDTVVPISAEADCLACHADPGDGGNGEATQTLFDEGVDVATADEDPHKGGVPLAVSIEYASDINILRLHDLKHGSEYPAGDDGNACDFLNVPSDPDCLVNRTPVVCQLCHYTPALDLAQVGPRDENGREQIDNKTMSNVMHSHHGALTDLFPAMPPPTDPARTSGPPVNDFESDILGRTCYRCHPGERTAGLRGAMFNAGILCQDCHGDMEQVGNDFSRSMPGGDFELSADYYTNPDTPRVPWANEPGCGSCHTGDAVDNLAGDTDKIAASTLNTGDTIRLIQAYRVGDTKATPIVPTNKRFAEDVVESGPAANNPKLYRLSSGGISLAPAHGKSGHGDLFCEVCHGTDGLGTVLSRTAASRYLECKEVQSGATDPGNGCSSVPGVGKRILVSKGEQIGCDLCHDNKINE